MEKERKLLTYTEADTEAQLIIDNLDITEKTELIGGHNFFFIKGIERFNIPELYLSDATQGIHIRQDLSGQLEKSTAFPSPILLAATWNPDLAHQYALCIGEECKAGGIAILLGPGVNIYRVSTCGRNFEYFGEDPYLTSRIVEQYVRGIQSNGVIATLKHFLCNNSDYHRRTSNSVVDERTLHEIYMPVFKAGIEAGAMAVMTAYNQLNEEWCGQSDYVIKKLLREELGFKWLVMTDWWSVFDPVKVVKSGQDLEMPGEGKPTLYEISELGDIYVRSNAKKLLQEGKITEQDIDRMAKSILRTSIAMGFHKRPLTDTSFLEKFNEHEQVALQVAREGIVLLKNQHNILPLKKDPTRNILLTGEYVEQLAKGGGSADVEGYNHVTLWDALSNEFSGQVEYIPAPTDNEISTASYVILSIGTFDNEGWDRPFELPAEQETNILKIASLNPNTVVIVNSGSGIKMTDWNEKISGLIYSWYPGQNGNIALAEILSGKICPSGKLPFTIEKRFEDSPGYPYIPDGETFYTGWEPDHNVKKPVHTIEYKEGIFVGYRWYEHNAIVPLYPFGFGLSYTTFEFSNLKLSATSIKKGETLSVSFDIKNTGTREGSEVSQLYMRDCDSSVPRPVKELKGFKKVSLQPGQSLTVTMLLTDKELSFWDTESHKWKAEEGKFEILIGTSSNSIVLKNEFELTLK